MDHDEPERGAGGRRGRPAVDVMRHGEPGGDVDVRRVDLDGVQVVEGDRGFTRPGLSLEDDSVGDRHVGWSLGALVVRQRGHPRDRDIVQPHGIGLGPVMHVVPGAQVAAMVLVRGHFGQRPAKLGQGLEVQAVAGVVHAVGDAVVGVPCGAGGAPGDGGGVACAAHRPAGGPCRRVLRPSAEDPFAAAAQQLDQRQHRLVLAHSGFLFVDDGFSGRARRSRSGGCSASSGGWFGGSAFRWEDGAELSRGTYSRASAEGMMVLPGVGAVRAGGSP